MPLPRMLGSVALLLGGLLMAGVEVAPGTKGHHSGWGKWGRVALGVGAAYWGFLYTAEAVEQFRVAKGG